jgi:hypothetical protein
MIPTTLTIANKTSNYTILESESGTVFTNFGAGETVTLFLPENTSNGIYYIFSVPTAQQFRIDPGIGTIRGVDFNPSMISDKYIWADAPGETIILISNGVNEWYPMDIFGTWTVEI